MEKQKIKNWGWSIPDELLERTDLDMYEKILLAIMGRLGALEKPIYPRHKWLAKKLGMSESGVGKILKRLRSKDLVKYEGRKWKIAMYSLTYLSGSLSPTYQVGDSPTYQATHNKDIQSKDIQINNTVDGLQPSMFNTLKDYFFLLVKKQGFTPVFDGGDGRILKTVIKKYPEQTLKALIDFYLNSDKAKRCGITLKAIFSTHSINSYNAENISNKFL